MTVNPRIENLPAWVSAGVRQVAAMAELPEIFPKAYQQVAGAIAAAGGELRGPAYAHYFGMPSDTVDVEIGFLVNVTKLWLQSNKLTSLPRTIGSRPRASPEAASFWSRTIRSAPFWPAPCCAAKVAWCRRRLTATRRCRR